jgi:FdrA protein
VGALATLAALEALERDAATHTIVLISKPPAAEVAKRVLEQVGRGAKPCVVCFLGRAPGRLPRNARAARTLREAAELALGRSLGSPEAAQPPRRAGAVRGLFCGGTLCAEAQIVFLERGLAVRSNAAVPGAEETDGKAPHLFLDLGDDAYTRGRPHPMLEPEIRNDFLREALAAPETAAVLLDVVIGFGAHEDPAGVLAAALGAHDDRQRVPVIASVTGTEGDPQVWSRQAAALRAAGVIVAGSNAEAAALAASVVPPLP